MRRTAVVAPRRFLSRIALFGNDPARRTRKTVLGDYSREIPVLKESGTMNAFATGPHGGNCHRTGPTGATTVPQHRSEDRRDAKLIVNSIGPSGGGTSRGSA